MERIMRSFLPSLTNHMRFCPVISSRTQLSSYPLLSQRWHSSTEVHKSKQTEDVINDKPISYTKSKAFDYKASQNFRVTDEELTYPSYTRIIVKISIAIFLIYFGYLREENDVDQMLSRNLFEIVPELEIPFLELEVKRLEANGVETETLRLKIEELKKLENKLKSQS